MARFLMMTKFDHLWAVKREYFFMDPCLIKNENLQDRKTSFFVEFSTLLSVAA